MTEDERGEAAIQFHTDHALALHKARQPQNESLEYCEECGIEIPELRRRAVTGCTMCIDCKQDHDKVSRRYG